MWNETHQINTSMIVPHYDHTVSIVHNVKHFIISVSHETVPYYSFQYYL
jgi:hypothetical protein